MLIVDAVIIGLLSSPQLGMFPDAHAAPCGLDLGVPPSLQSRA